MGRFLSGLAILVVGVALGLVVNARRDPGPVQITAAKVRPPTLLEAPEDPSAWLAFADAQAASGRNRGAEAAYRGALSLQPDDGNANARLGYLLYELGRDAEAALLLSRAQELGADPKLLDFTVSLMRSHVDLAGPFPRFVEEGEAHEEDEDFHEAPAPEPPLSEGAPVEEAPVEEAPVDEPQIEEPVVEEAAVLGPCELALRRYGEQGTYLIDVEIGGRGATLIFDTGASLTVVSRRFLRSIGAEIDESGPIVARTAAGLRHFDLAVLERIVVGERAVDDLRVAVCDECESEYSDGLLGLDVQRPLGLSLDLERDIVRFGNCR